MDHKDHTHAPTVYWLASVIFTIVPSLYVPSGCLASTTAAALTNRACQINARLPPRRRKTYFKWSDLQWLVAPHVFIGYRVCTLPFEVHLQTKRNLWSELLYIAEILTIGRPILQLTLHFTSFFTSLTVASQKAPLYLALTSVPRLKLAGSLACTNVGFSSEIPHNSSLAEWIALQLFTIASWDVNDDLIPSGGRRD